MDRCSALPYFALNFFALNFLEALLPRLSAAGDGVVISAMGGSFL
jgi:hypothetical protein